MIKFLKRIYRNFYFSILSKAIIFFRSINLRFNYSISKFPKLNNEQISKVILVGTGPSLLKEDIYKLKSQGYKIVGVNGILRFLNKSEWNILDYYVIQDIQVFDKLKEDVLEFSKSGICFFASTILYKYKLNNVKCYIYPLNMLNHYLPKYTEPYFTKYSHSSNKIVYDGYTVIYSAIQLFDYLGFSEIGLLGIDAGYNKDISKRNVVSINKIDPTWEKAGDRINYSINLADQNLRKINKKLINFTRGGNLKNITRQSLLN